MDLQFFCLPFLFSSVFILIISLKLVKSFRSSINGRKLSKLPPGPWRLPLIGSIHHLGGSPPHRRFRELSQRYGPLMYLQLGEISTVVVSSAEAAKEVLKTHDMIFAQRPRLAGADIVFYGPSSIVLSPTGDYWKLLRKICSQELLNAMHVKSFQSLRKKEVSSLIKSLRAEAGSSVNLTEKVFATVCGITSKSAFGEKHTVQLEAILSVCNRILRLSKDISDLFPSQKWLQGITGMRRKLEEIYKQNDLVLENIILGELAAKNKEGEEEEQYLLSTLLNLTDHGDLTINNVKAVILDVILAGIEPASRSVEWAMAEMLRKPKVMKRAQAEVRQVFRSKGCIDETTLEELKYLKAVIKETLRLYPPSPLLAPRECTQTCEINGCTIPVGTQVFVNIWAIGRDSNYWSLPEDFFPDRFMNCSIDYKGLNFEYIPFGSGKRMCPGMLFGSAISEIIIAHLLCHFDWELPPGTTAENLDMTEVFGSTLNKKNNLILVPISYNPALPEENESAWEVA